MLLGQGFCWKDLSNFITNGSTFISNIESQFTKYFPSNIYLSNSTLNLNRNTQSKRQRKFSILHPVSRLAPITYWGVHDKHAGHVLEDLLRQFVSLFEHTVLTAQPRLCQQPHQPGDRPYIIQTRSKNLFPSFELPQMLHNKNQLLSA